MSAGSLGSAQGEILINVEQAIANLEKLAAALRNTDGAGAGIGQGISQSGSKLDQLGAKADSLNAKYGQLGKIGLGAGALVAAGFGLAVGTAANFEAAMDGVGASLGGVGVEGGITNEQFDRLNDKALELGANTSASANEVAGVMTALARGGIPVEEMYNGVAQAAVNVSEATGESLGQSASTVASLQNLFRDTGVTGAEMADTIVNAMNASDATMSEFQTGIANMAPLIAGTNMEIGEAAGLLSFFNSKGIAAAKVGTSLNSAYTNLIAPTTEMAAAQQELGIQVYDSQGNFRGLPAILDDVRTATEGMTQADRDSYLTRLFGAEAADVVRVALQAETGEIENHIAAMDKQGTAATASAQRMDNLKGSLEQLKGAIESAMIIVGSSLTPIIRTIADALAGLVNMFLNLPGPIQTAIAAVIGIAGALAGLAGAIVVFGPQAVLIAKQMQAMVTAFTGLLAINPIVLAIVAALALLAIAYKTNFLGFADKVNAGVDKLKSGFQSAVKTIKPFVDQFNRLRQVTNPVSAAMLTLSSVFRSLSGMGGPLSGVFSAIAEGLVKGANMVSQFVARFNELRGEVNVVQAFFQALGDTLTRFAGSFGPLEGAIESLGSAFQNIADGIGDVIDAFQAMFEGNWGEAFDEIVEAASNFGKAILDLYQVIPQALAGIGQALWDFLSEVDWGGLWDGITSAVSGLWDTLTTTISNINWGSVGDYIVGAAESLAGKAEEMVQGFLDALVENFPRVLSWIGSIGQFIAAAQASAIQWLAPRAVEAITGFLNALVANFPRVLSWIGSIGQFIGAAIADAAQWLAPRAIEAITGFLDTLVENFPRVLAWVGSIGQFIQVAVGSLVDTLKDKGTDLIEGFASAVSDRWDEFTTWIGENISVSALSALIPDLAIPNPFATIMKYIEDLVSAAENAIEILRKLKFWEDNGTDTPRQQNEQGSGTGNRPQHSSSPGTLANGTLVTALPNVGSGPGSALAQVQAMAQQIGQAIAELATRVAAGTQQALAGLQPLGTGFQTISAQAQAAIAQMASQVQARFAAMASQAGSTANQMRSQVSSAVQGMQSQTVSIVSNLASQVQSRFSQMSSQASSQANTMRSQVGSAMSGMASQASAALNQFASAVQSSFQRAVSAAQSGVNSIRSTLASASSGAYSYGYQVGAQFADGLEASLSRVLAAAAAIRNAMPSSPAKIGPLSKPISFSYIADNLEKNMDLLGGIARGGAQDVMAGWADLMPSSSLASMQSMPVVGRSTVINHVVNVYPLRSDEYQKLISNAEIGADFARELAFSSLR